MVWIEKSVTRVTDRHHEAFSCIPFRFTAFDFPSRICYEITRFPVKIYSLVGNIKTIFVNYFLQHVRNGLIVYLTNSLKKNIC